MMDQTGQPRRHWHPVRWFQQLSRIGKTLVAIITGLAVVVGAVVATRNWWVDRTDPYRADVRFLQVMDVGTDLTFVSERLGQPRRTFSVPPFTLHVFENEAYRMHAVTGDGMTTYGRAALPSTLVAFGVTALSEDFHPSIQPFGSSRPSPPSEGGIRLGKTRFIDVGQSPSAVAGFTGHAGSEFSYAERHSYGLSERHRQYVYAIDQGGAHIGPIGDTVTFAMLPLLSRNRRLDAWKSADDQRALDNWLAQPQTVNLRSSLINTYWILDPDVEFTAIAKAVRWSD